MSGRYIGVDGCACHALNDIADEAYEAPAYARSEIVITVHGTPAGQGRISFGRGGRGYHSNEKELKAWRRAVVDAALAVTGDHEFTAFAASIRKDTACAKCGVLKGTHAILVGVPVRAEITVTVEKPKSAPKRTETWPITRHSTDSDHHARAALDSLSAAGVFSDDSQVVEVTCRKLYPGQHPDTLGQPGAVIRVSRFGGAA